MARALYFVLRITCLQSTCLLSHCLFTQFDHYTSLIFHHLMQGLISHALGKSTNEVIIITLSCRIISEKLLNKGKNAGGWGLAVDNFRNRTHNL